MIDSVFSRDFFIVQGVHPVPAVGYVVANLAVDILYSYLDPRIRVHEWAAPASPPSRSASSGAAIVGLVGAVLVASSCVVAALAPLLSPYDPVAADFANVLRRRRAQHPFGTDDIGRDILSRVVYGAASRCRRVCSPWRSRCPSACRWAWWRAICGGRWTT